MKHKSISYITNISLNQFSGGISGQNKATFEILTKHFKIEDYTVINPKPILYQKILSKFLLLVGLKRFYYFFSKRRLNKIERIYSKQKISGHEVFFMGITPWIHIKPKQPYYCYNDACFATYVDIYNKKEQFSSSDLNRLFKREKLWLSKAKKVFFTSQWSLEQAKSAYQLEGVNFYNIGIGGNINVPDKDTFKGEFNFLFMAKEFIPKGGAIVVQAIQTVRKKYPQVQLWILGAPPNDVFIKESGIHYKGYFDKSITSQKEELIKLLSQAFCLIHPTLKDLSPNVITESAYFGCPTIASNRFAIPEFIEHGTTGLLINDPRDVEEVAKHMCYLIEHPNIYKTMRKNLRTKALNHFTWEAVGEKFKQHISA